MTTRKAAISIDAGRLRGLTPERQDDIDAFPKRFRTRRSSALPFAKERIRARCCGATSPSLMERLGTLPSATQFRDFVAVRNRLAHLYPEDPRQAMNLNATYEAAPALLQLTERISARAALPGEDDRPQAGD